VGAADRTVQRLCLRAPSAQAAVHAVHRLEDALRCASLPDAGERVLLVRRLHLGQLPKGLSSQSMGLLIEQQLAALGGSWVHGVDQHAAESDTVFFASRLEAAQVAVLRRAQGGELSAWYWPLALPGVAVQAGAARFLDSLLNRLAEERYASAALPALVAHGVAHGLGLWWGQHLQTRSMDLLLDRSRARRWLERTNRMASSALDTHAGSMQYIDTEGTVHSLPEGVCPGWLHAMLTASNWRALAPAGTSRAPAPQGTSDARGEDLQALPMEGRWGTNLGAGAMPPPTSTQGGRAEALRAEPLMGSHDRTLRTTALPDIPGLQPAAAKALDAAVPTAAGGLLFLLNVLERLGFSNWQGVQEDAALAGLLLRRVLERLRVTEADPTWPLVSALRHPGSSRPRPWSAPASWGSAGVGLAHDPVQPLTPTQMSDRWLLAIRRYLRRVARVGLASLCLRPARMCWSATHVEVLFGLDQADLRVRRLGLDVDPGWLPWLERVVVFRFDPVAAP
jgi:hypothetical protein